MKTMIKHLIIILLLSLVFKQAQAVVIFDMGEGVYYICGDDDDGDGAWLKSECEIVISDEDNIGGGSLPDPIDPDSPFIDPIPSPGDGGITGGGAKTNPPDPLLDINDPTAPKPLEPKCNCCNNSFSFKCIRNIYNATKVKSIATTLLTSAYVFFSYITQDFSGILEKYSGEFDYIKAEV